MGICQHADSKIGGKFHSLATTSKKQPRVKRDTFSAGARAVGDAASMCTVFARLIQEMDMEPSSCATLADAQIGEVPARKSSGSRTARVSSRLARRRRFSYLLRATWPIQ
eukprot:2035284-Pyramimonas_sp.AAC.1